VAPAEVDDAAALPAVSPVAQEKQQNLSGDGMPQVSTAPPR
jgi:hypothetical protein